MARLTPALVRALIQSREWTTHDACRRAGINSPNLYNFLNGRTQTLSIETRRKLARLFPEAAHLLAAEILGGDDT